MGTQTTARTMAHRGVEGGMSHGGVLTDDTRGTTDEDKANGGGDRGRAKEPMSPCNIDRSGDRCGATAMSV